MEPISRILQLSAQFEEIRNLQCTVYANLSTCCRQSITKLMTNLKFLVNVREHKCIFNTVQEIYFIGLLRRTFCEERASPWRPRKRGMAKERLGSVSRALALARTFVKDVGSSGRWTSVNSTRPVKVTFPVTVTVVWSIRNWEKSYFYRVLNS